MAAANSKDFDEFYTYDGLRQLTGLDFGDLKSDKSGIDGTPAGCSTPTCPPRQSNTI